MEQKDEHFRNIKTTTIMQTIEIKAPIKRRKQRTINKNSSPRAIKRLTPNHNRSCGTATNGDRSDSHGLLISLNKKHATEFLFKHSEKTLLEFLTQMATIISNHTDFKDQDWDVNTSLNEIASHMLNQATLITKPHGELTYDLRSHDFYLCNPILQSTDYGNLVAFSWIDRLKKKNKDAYNLVIPFLNISARHLGIPLWDYDLDEQLECLEEECWREAEEQDQDYDEDENEHYHWTQHTIAEYQGHVAKVLYHEVLSDKTSPLVFKIKLNNWHPRKEEYRKLKTWMLGICEFVKQGFKYNDYVIPAEAIPTSEDDQYVPPYEYSRFVWDLDDQIGESMKWRLDEMWGNCNLIPFYIFKTLTPENINKPLEKEDLFDNWSTWMDQGKQFSDIF